MTRQLAHLGESEIANLDRVRVTRRLAQEGTAEWIVGVYEPASEQPLANLELKLPAQVALGDVEDETARLLLELGVGVRSWQARGNYVAHGRCGLTAAE